ncbi:hypothetical protein CAter282_4209 [Collimonas arenae]|uniref:DUF3717 domain-containing protein n=1 Tax=Collimonas arenae TaxID=279058 RepID=A0A127QP34_9BURK|nr:hypothetical protein CAter10_4583 [Collimonas arenae]AMP11870.1 hypothetical protein CAter282_4209 [Collimonas arenae]
MPELEQAINYWRLQRPAVGEECALSPEVNALADVYALMIINRSSSVALASMGSVAQQLIAAWRQHMFDLASARSVS